MIVEIDGINCKKLENFLSLMGLVKKKSGKKIRVSMDIREVCQVNIHDSVWGADGIWVFWGEQKAGCMTMEGSRGWILFILGGFLSAKDLFSSQELLLHLINKIAKEPVE